VYNKDHTNNNMPVSSSVSIHKKKNTSQRIQSNNAGHTHTHTHNNTAVSLPHTAHTHTTPSINNININKKNKPRKDKGKRYHLERLLKRKIRGNHVWYYVQLRKGVCVCVCVCVCCVCVC